MDLDRDCGLLPDVSQQRWNDSGIFFRRDVFRRLFLSRDNQQNFCESDDFFFHAFLQDDKKNFFDFGKTIFAYEIIAKTGKKRYNRKKTKDGEKAKEGTRWQEKQKRKEKKSS
ncbi:MAG: hypothetical protein SO016_06335 [Lachnospiraceae bacterium]|nr:hypothetical protein [Robinsoniella sp.]MDY3766303.1 hypothetical protein [Lachnospiraceae bacterium]